jgi:hypothetical protein
MARASQSLHQLCFRKGLALSDRQPPARRASVSSHDRTLGRIGVVRQIIQRFHQEVSREWLTEKSDTACFHGSSFDLLVVASADEYHRECNATIGELTHKLNTATVAHLDIDNQANRLGRHDRLQELVGRDVEFYIKSMYRQQTSHGIEDTGVIIDNRNNGILR